MTGRRPFSGEAGQILLDKRNPSYDVLGALADLAVPDAIAEFLRRALTFEPSARFRSVAEFRAALHVAFSAAVSSSRHELVSIDLSELALGSGSQEVRGRDGDLGAQSLSSDPPRVFVSRSLQPEDSVAESRSVGPLPTAAVTASAVLNQPAPRRAQITPPQGAEATAAVGRSELESRPLPQRLRGALAFEGPAPTGTKRRRPLVLALLAACGKTRNPISFARL